MRKILLYGQGSYDNRGCEAIVLSTTSQIKKSGDKVVSATFDLKNSKTKYNDLIDEYIKHYYKEDELRKKDLELNNYYKSIPFNYMNFEKLYQKDVIKKIDECDICLSIGGDNYCYGYSRWLYAISDEIRKKQKKNVLWCASLFENILDDELIDEMKNFDLIMAREPLTYNALLKYVDKKRLMLVPDPAFSLKIKKIELGNFFDKEVIGINLSPLVLKNNENIYNNVINLIDDILNNTQSNIALIPHVFLKESNDLDILKKISDKFKTNKRVKLFNLKNNNCEEIKYVISKCSFLLASRTHASIAAYSTNVPTLVIGYSIKSKGIAEYLFGTYEKYVISSDELNYEVLKETFYELYNNRKNISNLLKQKNKIIQKEAKNLYNNMINKLEELEDNITIETYCTGCGACYNVCPVNAIDMKSNKEGFKYPVINKKKCINCGACKKICPCNNNYKYIYKDIKAYAAYSKTDKYKNLSSSGAIFPLIAAKILKNKGIVYGCSGSINPKHIRIEKTNNLNKILGSKYVQSDINFIYKKVKEDLLNHKMVLFSGTPCQIEGLKKYLKNDYDNLYCLSVICHGIPSKKTLKKYLDSKFKGKKITDINFRYQIDNLRFIKYSLEKKNEFIKSNEDLYMKSFLQNYSLRNSCYKCQFKLFEKNTADIILGDYWGWQQYHQFNQEIDNVSAVICNSKKGNFLFELIKDEINFEVTNLNNIIDGNILLTKKVNYSKDRENFLNRINNEDFIDVIEDIIFKSDYQKLLKENKDIKNENIKLHNEINNLNEKLINIQENLNLIIHSRKWKAATALFDPAIRIKKRIRKRR